MDEAGSSRLMVMKGRFLRDLLKSLKWTFKKKKTEKNATTASTWKNVPSFSHFTPCIINAPLRSLRTLDTSRSKMPRSTPAQFYLTFQGGWGGAITDVSADKSLPQLWSHTWAASWFLFCTGVRLKLEWTAIATSREAPATRQLGSLFTHKKKQENPVLTLRAN